MGQNFEEYNYLFLTSSKMSSSTMRELLDFPNVYCINKSKLSTNKVFDCLLKICLRTRWNKIRLKRFRWIIYKYLFKGIPCEKQVVIMSPPWYNDDLFDFIKTHFSEVRLCARFIDKLDVGLRNNKALSINKLQTQFDKVLVYNPEDASNNGFVFCPAGFSKTPIEMLMDFPHVDVCFIGAAKNRLSEIKAAYKILSEYGLCCFFYVTDVPVVERDNSGIIYADENLSYIDYLSRENSSSCLLEILQAGTTGRTFRLMEAICYNKQLITNCPEILSMRFYDNKKIQYVKNMQDIIPSFVDPNLNIDYQYNDEFSSIQILKLAII